MTNLKKESTEYDFYPSLEIYEKFFSYSSYRIVTKVFVQRKELRLVEKLSYSVFFNRRYSLSSVT